MAILDIRLRCATRRINEQIVDLAAGGAYELSFEKLHTNSTGYPVSACQMARPAKSGMIM